MGKIHQLSEVFACTKVVDRSPLRVPSVNATNMVPIAGASARARGFGSKPAFCERQAHQAQGELGWRELGRFDQEILEIYSWANVRM